jgi:integrase
MASISKRGKRWRVVWREQGAKGPRSVQYCSTKPEAVELAKRVEAERAAKRPVKRLALITWAELVERLALSRERAGRGVQHIEHSTSALKRLGERHGWDHAIDVGPDDVDGLGAYHRRAVRAALRYAQVLGQEVHPRVLGLLSPPPARKRPQALLNAAAVKSLVARAAKTHPANGAIAHLIATYGHRAMSLVGIDGSALDGDHLTLPLKNGDTHRHPLLPISVAILKALRPKAGVPMFVGHLGRAWASGSEFATWWSHQIADGPGQGILDLRRYAITRLLESCSHDAKTVASITGHRTPSLLLNVYARTTETRQRSALAGLSGTKWHQDNT